MDEKEKNINFMVSFSVDEEGVVNVFMDWPEIDMSESLKESTSNLLHTINSGELKTLCLKALFNSTTSGDKIRNDVYDIITKWSEHTLKKEGQPCVKPRDALRK